MEQNNPNNDQQNLQNTEDDYLDLTLGNDDNDDKVEEPNLDFGFQGFELGAIPSEAWFQDRTEGLF